MDKFNKAIEPLWVFLHRGHIIRRTVLFVAVWMTIDSYQWAKWYATTSEPNEIIYAAVLGVPSALLAAAIKFYSSGRIGTKIEDEQ
jgi:hypothetical protein